MERFVGKELSHLANVVTTVSRGLYPTRGQSSATAVPPPRIKPLPTSHCCPSQHRSTLEPRPGQRWPCVTVALEQDGTVPEEAGLAEKSGNAEQRSQALKLPSRFSSAAPPGFHKAAGPGLLGPSALSSLLPCPPRPSVPNLRRAGSYYLLHKTSPGRGILWKSHTQRAKEPHVA